ncbi:hypothetical protein ACJMK2_040104 [Sinanodonta woodiana]|uniref:TNF receptor-associated factor n=1 Tax=Sinanodonta woodiana TaxID=1069815 RepID=A0ABD3WE55_SINWO
MAGPVTPDGGYPVSLFVQQEFDKKFLCNLCQRILREPIQSFCGHRFCKRCIEIVISNGLQMCPQCKQEGVVEEEHSVLKADKLYPDNALKREMSQIKVRCVNPGCSWQGIFKEFENHASQCQYQMVPCPQCGNVTSQIELEDHKTKTCPKRLVNCRHCGQLTTSAEMSEHSKVCPKYPLMCELCKTKKIPRDRMEEHLSSECQNRKLKCPFDNQMVEASRFAGHVEQSAGNHMIYVIRQASNVEQRVNQLKERIDNLSGSETGLVAHQLQKMFDRMQQLEGVVQNLATRPMAISGTQSQPMESGEMQMRARHLEIKTDTFEAVVTTLHRDIEQCITTLETTDRQRRVDKEKIVSIQRNIVTFESALAQKDIKINELEVRIESLECASYDGILIWKIPEFRKRRLEAEQGKPFSIYSPAFYTSRTGYKMCARMYPNGDGMGKGSHMSLFFVIMRGSYDALLSWPFAQRVTFMLIDQNNREHVMDSFQVDKTSSSFQRPTTDMNIASGCPLFIPLRHLDDPSYGYIKEDTMFIKTVVDTSNLPVLNDNKTPADTSSQKKVNR